MDKIQKFSKEWFVTSASNETKAAARNLKQGAENNVQGNLERNVFDGTKQDVESWLSLIKKGPEVTKIIEQYGGLDNLFNLIDTDFDGNITPEESLGAASADTPEDAEKLDTKFTAKDLQEIYANVTAVDEAEVEETEKSKIYKFKDGSKTEVEYDSDGNVLKSVTEKTNKDGKVTKSVYDAAGKLVEVQGDGGEKQNIQQEDDLKIKNVTDEQGRIIKTVVEGKKVSQNKTVDIQYSKDGSKTVTTDTVGRTVVEKFDKDGNLVNKQQNFKYEGDLGGLDGIIDNTYQGSTGDCWLLAGVNAVAQTPAGKKILEDAIQIHEDGNVTITLKGVDRSYTYTPEQILSYEYASSPSATATGDYDMNLIEMAVTDYRKELLAKPENERPRAMKQANARSPLNGGTGEEIINYLTGKKGFTTADSNRIQNDIDAFAKNPERYAIVVNFRNDAENIYSEEAAELGDMSNVVNVISQHAYTISKVDDENVYVRDPRDSYWEIKYPKDKFFQNVIQASTVDLGT